MTEKKDKKLKINCPDLKTATREEKDNFIEILNYYIGLIEKEL